MTAPPAPGAQQQAERRRGYARWDGETSAQAWRWWVVARGNLSVAWANRWVKVVLIASLIPGVVVAGVTYLFLPLSAVMLYGVLRFSAVFAFLTAALVGARLVADDRRQGAFLAHFSRPVTRIDYLAGKFVALAIPVFFAASASGLFAIAGDASVDDAEFAQRIEDFGGNIPQNMDEAAYLREASYGAATGAVLWFGVAVAACTSGIVLGLSALTTRARIAGVIWFAVVGLGAAAHGLLGEALDQDWPALLSWLDTVNDVAGFLTGLDSDASEDRILEYGLFERVALLAAAALAGLVVVHEQLRRAEGGAR